MIIKTIAMLIYPILSLNLSDRERDQIKEILEKQFKDLSNDQIDEAFNIFLKKQELIDMSGQISAQEKNDYFRIAREIVDICGNPKEALVAMGKLGKALNIDSRETGFDFDIYNIDEINQREFQKAVLNFATVSAAVGFLPMPISDFVLLIPIQIGMIAKISNIYGFKMDPKQFLKMTGGVLGIGLILKYGARFLNSFIPVLGWGINATIAFSGTYAMAILTKRYIEANGELTKETIKAIWEKSYSEGKKEFLNLKEYIFKKKDELIKEIEKYRNEMKKMTSEEDLENGSQEGKGDDVPEKTGSNKQKIRTNKKNAT